MGGLSLNGCNAARRKVFKAHFTDQKKLRPKDTKSSKLHQERGGSHLLFDFPSLLCLESARSRGTARRSCHLCPGPSPGSGYHLVHK